MEMAILMIGINLVVFGVGYWFGFGAGHKHAKEVIFEVLEDEAEKLRRK